MATGHASIKVPKLWGSESFLIGEHIHVLGGWYSLNFMGTDTLMLGTLPVLAPCISDLAVDLFL